MDKLQKIKSKIILQENFNVWLKNIRPNIEKLVFTNGCFDIIHRGHITYLAQASDLGEKLIVALNTDKSVSKLKGETRPVQDEYTRALVMAAFQFVDYVCFFDEDTPEELIKSIMPNVLVKGGDYIVEKIVGYQDVMNAGGEVITIPFLDGFSTSAILKRV
jgi:D-glycero-beta-D-manno-heptose 1-phosphate adenylyltransferase